MSEIKGVQVRTLQVRSDERGRLMEILRCDDELFEQFGQVYITTAYPGVVKAWHYHKHQTDHVTCLRGMVKLVLFDVRDKESPVGPEEFYLGDHSPLLVKIPPCVCHGFKCVSSEEAIVLNVPTLPYNYDEPDEHRYPAHHYFPYEWAREDR